MNVLVNRPLPTVKDTLTVPIKRQDVQFFTGRGRRSVEAKWSQFTLSLAWGCIIHKFQGKMLDKIVVSMEGKGAFMPEQAHVAVSRIENLNGLYLLGFDTIAIRVNSAVLNKMNWLRQEVAPNTQLTDVTAPTKAFMKILTRSMKKT